MFLWHADSINLNTKHCCSFYDGSCRVLKTEYRLLSEDIVQYYSPNFYWGAWESFCKITNQFMSTIFH